jgi:hypothetical protein
MGKKSLISGMAAACILTRKCFVENPEKTQCIACKSEYKADIIIIVG